MKLSILMIALCAFFTHDWLVDFSKAQELASSEHKLILLNFSGSDWCGPCIKMKKEVFESEAFQSVADKKLVLVRADFPRSKKNKLSPEQAKHNEALAAKYNPEGKFPFTILMTSAGEVIKHWDGYTFSTQDKFIEALSKAIESK